MPKRLPIADILAGLARSMGTAIRYWLHYTLVAVAWLGVVPLTACRIYRCLFTGSVSSVLTLPLDMLSTDNLVSDIFHGCFVVTCTLSAFISLVWLREQILHGGGPDWLDQEIQHEHEPPGNFGAVNQVNGQIPVPVANENVAPQQQEVANENLDINDDPGNQELAPVPANQNIGEGGEGEILHEGAPGNNNLDPGAAADDLNWNPIEWDRAAEELTWERLLGLDGSLVFLEHDREVSFKMAPGTSMFIHWLVGMVYVFYFASFILLLREVLRPGVLWFLRNLNDPDFNPVQEVNDPPAYVRHTRRFLASMVIFGSTVLLMLWLPIKIIHGLWPSFLPYHITLSSDTPVSELSLELLLLQVILPALLEQGHTRVWLKLLVRHWCAAVSHILGLRSYLLGDVALDAQLELLEKVCSCAAAPPVEVEQADPELVEGLVNPVVGGPGGGDALGGGLGAAHQALLQRDGPTGFQAYVRPRWFGVRILGLVVMMCVSLTAASIICLTLPVLVGRQCMYLALGDTKVHELYTGACGLYLCLLSIRGITLLISWIMLGWSQVILRLKQWGIMGTKALVALVVVATPIIFLWQDWALGVLYTKIMCALVMMGPNWWLKTNLEHIYLGGVRGLDLNLLVGQTALPVIASLGACLTIPYVTAHTLALSLYPLVHWSWWSVAYILHC
ncbi:hypothetical protein C7M84_019575 [Penaeus vannamei]|uniref:RING-type E3 ubiquitin transferase n=1 Tax=Penaeus vannamei TaxID=6689 RepID=A0A423SEE7_PENVA|nr:hypothetical protein C7M84_019575 [Penaeus vannamei]